MFMSVNHARRAGRVPYTNPLVVVDMALVHSTLNLLLPLGANFFDIVDFGSIAIHFGFEILDLSGSEAAPIRI